MPTSTDSRACRASNGIFYRLEGQGAPLLLLHGLLASGIMFDPLIEILRGRFRMLVPDLRGHGQSGSLDGPYDVSALAADLSVVLAEAGFERAAVMGYSHGGAVAQQLARNRPDAVNKLLLGCTYACNVSTTRERIEAWTFLTLLHLFSPGTIGKMIVLAAKPRAGGQVALTSAQARWLQSILAGNKSKAMRGATRGMIAFDSRSWLEDIRAPPLVVGGSHDAGVPRHHFDMLVSGIPGASGRLVGRAGHTLIWTHTSELARIMCEEWRGASTS